MISESVRQRIARMIDEIKNDPAPYAGTQRHLLSTLGQFLETPTPELFATITRVAGDYMEMRTKK